MAFSFRQFVLVVIACLAIEIPSVFGQTKPVSEAIKLYYGLNKDARSPDGKSAIRCRTPKEPAKDGNDEPRLFAIRGNRSLYLGRLVRSGDVFWRPDSKLAIFNDDRGSDHAEFSIVRVAPELSQTRSGYTRIRARWRREFNSGEIVHDYTRGEGWLNATDLLVSVYVDALPHGKKDGPTIGFCRGYVLNTDNLTIEREVSKERLRKLVATDGCWW